MSEERIYFSETNVWRARVNTLESKSRGNIAEEFQRNTRARLRLEGFQSNEQFHESDHKSLEEDFIGAEINLRDAKGTDETGKGGEGGRSKEA